MEDYRSAHHAKYLERIQEIEKREKLQLEKIQKLEKLVEDIKAHTTMNQIKTTVNEMLETIESDESLDKQKLSQIGLDLVEAINTNKFTVTDFNNQTHVLMSRDVHAIVKSILSLCGIDDSIEVQYEMDCSRDEEIARQLTFEPPVLRRRRSRPATARPRRGQMAV
jgi:hypothetical protein